MLYSRAMFLRRRKISWIERLREFVWPRAGWVRVGNYLILRMARLPGTPYYAAAGFACGAAISFTPFVGMHLAVACILAWGLRASPVAAAVGTLVGNPWTFPVIWIWIYKTGKWLLGVPPTAHANNLDFTVVFSTILEALLRFDFVELFQTAWPIYWPMIVGGVPMAIVAGFASYFLVRPIVVVFQNRRLKRRERRRESRHAPAPSTGR